MPTIATGDLEIACAISGPEDGSPVLLLHGWPDDASTWDEVAPALAKAGHRVIVPTLRGFGDTRFRDDQALRTGNSAVLALDAIALMDALGIERFAAVGHDWGANAVEALAVGWPDRVERIAMLSTPPRLGGMPTPPFWHAELEWYHWFMATARGAAAVGADRRGFAHRHWENWAPAGWFSEATFQRVARAWDNPDWVDVTLHSYRARWDEAEPDPASRWLEDKIKATDTLPLPTIYIQGAEDGVNPPAASKNVPGKFTGPFEFFLLAGIGHFPQREAPDRVARILTKFLASRAGAGSRRGHLLAGLALGGMAVLAGAAADRATSRARSRRPGTRPSPSLPTPEAPMTPLRYTPDIEQPRPDEQEAIDGIIKGMTQQSETVEQREGSAVRASHAKSSACVVGELTVAEGLPRELAQGLFATPGRYAAAVRFAQGPGERLGDRVSTHRGMAIKLFGVQGDRLPGHATDTQDWVLATGTTFPSGTAQGFLRDGSVIGKTAGMPEGVKSAVSSAARNFNRLLHAFGGESAMADFFGHPFSHPLSESYFSQAPIRFGDHVAKLAAVPVAPGQLALADWRLDPHEDEDGFRHAAVAYFRDHPAVYEIKAQLWVDADRQPIEDASVDWPVSLSPYRTVGTLRLPAQDAYSRARQHYFDEALTFRPAHSLLAHRPLGSVMRARLQVYQALSAFRHRETGVAEADPSSPDQIPA